MPSPYLWKAKASVLLQEKSKKINTRFKRETWEGSPRLQLSSPSRFKKLNIRLLPIFPAVIAFVALILVFLCLFAGSRPGYMDGYYLLSLNTSSVGLNIMKATTNPTITSSTLPTFPNTLSALINSLLNGMQTDFNYIASTITKKLGLMDFYSVHMMDYCFGHTNSKKSTGCSTRTVLFAFEPLPILQKALEAAGIAVNVESLNWPQALQDGIAQLKLIAHVAFAIYGVSIVFSFLTMIACAYWSSPYSNGGRKIIAVALTMGAAAFGTLMFASVLITILIDKGQYLVGKYGKSMGITVNKGYRYLGLTWAATLLAFVGMVAIGAECCRKRNREAFKVFFEK